MSNDPHETPTPLEVRHEEPIVPPHPAEPHPDTPSAPLPGHSPAARTGESDSDAALEPELSAGADATSEPELPAGDDARPEPELPAGDDATADGEEDPSEVEPVTRTARQLSHEVAGIAGVESLAPGMKDLVASATARVLRRAGGQPTGIDLSESDDGWRVRIDAHFDDSRSVASIVDEIFTVVDREVGAPVEVDLRVISRGGSH
ncbi:hypothetical protein M3G43_01420 [Brevibacterium casei]|uniref:hypothetical protein n=1 Tax=Brevibacterium casei TaxID=33889 RepID=UPI00223C45F8|nr:hypothetical protein [Brevibacterium casei]MCT1445928.1 hypothetical protein [Brevibacterium casei]MDH5148397.1 hypothetical protein [Brevibacterium casei]